MRCLLWLLGALVMAPACRCNARAKTELVKVAREICEHLDCSLTTEIELTARVYYLLPRDLFKTTGNLDEAFRPLERRLRELNEATASAIHEELPDRRTRVTSSIATITAPSDPRTCSGWGFPRPAKHEWPLTLGVWWKPGKDGSYDPHLVVCNHDRMLRGIRFMDNSLIYDLQKTVRQITCELTPSCRSDRLIVIEELTPKQTPATTVN